MQGTTERHVLTACSRMGPALRMVKAANAPDVTAVTAAVVPVKLGSAGIWQPGIRRGHHLRTR